MRSQIAIAVISWNTRELLRRCLQSLEPQARSGRAEVWVVDNDSSDGSADVVVEEFPWVRLIRSDENLGFGPAVNEVAARTSCEWLAPANADVELLPGALDALLAAGSAHADTGIVAPRLLLPDATTQHSVHAFPTVRLSLAFQLGLHRVLPGLGNRLCIEGYWDSAVSRWVDWAHGALLLVRREAFDSVGGFDPDQWMYAEDIDLAWRLRGAGWRARYEPSARVNHAHSAAAARAFEGERLATIMRASYAWMARRRPIAVVWTFATVNIAGAAVRLAFLTPAAAIAPRRWGPQRRLVSGYLSVHRLGLRRRATLLREAPSARLAREPTGTRSALR